jgi:bifunctional oligoribonuclease and PAP phosphatase NrnA
MTTEFSAERVSRLSSIIGQVKRVVLTTADLDGDSVGAMVAMWDYLSQAFPATPAVVRIESPLPERYNFLGLDGCGFDQASEDEDWSDAFVLVMDSEPQRFKRLGPVFWSAQARGVIDHHQKVNTSQYDFALYDAFAPSTTTLIYGLYQESGLIPSIGAASALYAGLVFDTSVFRYKLTTPFSLRMAADLTELGVDHANIVECLLLVQPVSRVLLRALVLSKLELSFSGRLCVSVLSELETGTTDSGGLVDDLIFIEGVDIAALCVSIPNGRVRLSLRSRSAIDVADIARALHSSGGGHRRASGVTLNCTATEALERLKTIAARHLPCI